MCRRRWPRTNLSWRYRDGGPPRQRSGAHPDRPARAPLRCARVGAAAVELAPLAPFVDGTLARASRPAGACSAGRGARVGAAGFETAVRRFWMRQRSGAHPKASVRPCALRRACARRLCAACHHEKSRRPDRGAVRQNPNEVPRLSLRHLGRGGGIRTHDPLTPSQVR